MNDGEELLDRITRVRDFARFARHDCDRVLQMLRGAGDPKPLLSGSGLALAKCKLLTGQAVSILSLMCRYVEEEEGRMRSILGAGPGGDDDEGDTQYADSAYLSPTTTAVRRRVTAWRSGHCLPDRIIGVWQFD